MSRPHRRLIALLAVPLVLLISGCIRMTASYEIVSEDSVQVAMDIGVSSDALAQMGQEMPDFCAEVDSMGVPGFMQEEYTDEGAEGYSGCRISGRAPISQLNSSGTSFALEEDIWTFSMEGDGSGQMDGMSAEMFSDFQIRVTFPGKVLSNSGTSVVEGTTVVWDSPADLFTPEGLTATAENDGIGSLPWLWIAIATVVVFSVIVGLALIVQRRRHKAASSQQEGPFAGSEGNHFPPAGVFYPGGQAHPPQAAGPDNARAYPPQSPGPE
ncbi:MAG: LppM family (lipo)protein [Arachnia sp.]